MFGAMPALTCTYLLRIWARRGGDNGSYSLISGQMLPAIQWATDNSFKPNPPLGLA